MSSKTWCCNLLRGMLHKGIPLAVNGGRLDLSSATGWGQDYGSTWGGSAAQYGVQAGGAVLMPFSTAIGSASKIMITPKVQNIAGEEVDYTGRGQSCEGKNIVTGFGLEIEIACHSAENLRDAFYGELLDQSMQTLSFTLPLRNSVLVEDDMLILPYIIDTAAPVTVTPSWGASPALVGGVDYEVLATGIHMLKTVAGIPAGATLGISFTTVPDVSAVDFGKLPDLVTSVAMDGKNLDGGHPFSLQAYRVKWNLADSLELINTSAFGKLAIKGDILPCYFPGSSKPNFMKMVGVTRTA